MRLTFAIFAATAALAGCASKDPGGSPAAGNGVNDVRKACDLRAQWTRSTVRDCSNCVFVAPAEACACDPTPERGRCFSQQKTFALEPDCIPTIASCVQACKTSACACIDACYTGHETCRAAKSAVDGCVEDVCDPLCR